MCDIIRSCDNLLTLVVNFSSFYKRLEEEGRIKRKDYGAMHKPYPNTFNRRQLPLLCKNTGAIALVLLGLKAGR